MPAGMKRMTLEYPLETEDRTPERTVSFHRFIGIFGTGGQKAAMPAEQGGKRHFVYFDQYQQRFFHFSGS